MSRRRLLLAVLLAGSIAAFFAFDLGQYFRIEFFQSKQSAIEEFRRANPLAAAGIFFAIYVAVTGLSVPGAAILSVAVGAIFGLLWGTLIVSFASSIGATLAFLSSRFLFREAVRGRFGDRLRAIDAGLAKEGAFYLFALRLAPVFPFVLVNLLMGLTPVKTRTFYWVSQIGMLPATIVYVNAGTQLATIKSVSGILSPALIGSLVLLGLFPLVAKHLVESAKARRRLAKWPKPEKFERNLVVIGAGSAGLVAAYIAAAVKAKVTLIEKDRMGGDCLYTGCVPSKALIKSARLLAQAKRAREFGFKAMQVDFDFADVMERVQRVVRTVEPHDSAERYTRLGVECVQGEAKITSPWTVEVKTAAGLRTLTTRAIVIAAGARPFVPPIPGLAEIGCLTS
ncbi:MAG TPA: VTT domain-containing protein, partial [Burkholderiales bacterium]|nr:VTT domain-containing protein [Burkholderiales bacterium]